MLPARRSGSLASLAVCTIYETGQVGACLKGGLDALPAPGSDIGRITDQLWSQRQRASGSQEVYAD